MLLFSCSFLRWPDPAVPARASLVYWSRMASAITMLPDLQTGAACRIGVAIRDMITDLAGDQGPTPLPFPGLSVCRFTTPTLYDKAATAGTTVGAVLQGVKQLRIGS